MHENRILIHKLKNFENINSNFLIITLMLFGSILLAISAKVQVPFWPVPMTMQTFVIFLIGMTYSVRLSFATVAFYLFQGAIGLPVFAAGGGIAYLVGPTAGYLYGMLLASIVISYLANLGFSKTYVKSFKTGKFSASQGDAFRSDMGNLRPRPVPCPSLNRTQTGPRR